MVSVVEGLSTVPLFGRTIRGGTSLRVQIDIGDLGPLLDRSLLEFASNAYQKRWPDIDNLIAVRDPAIIDALEKDLDADLAKGLGPKKIVLFTPQQRKGDTLVVSSYVIGRLSKTPRRAVPVRVLRSHAFELPAALFYEGAVEVIRHEPSG